jgi:hypothetical protein
MDSPIQRGFLPPPWGAWFNSSGSPGFRYTAVAALLHPGLQSVVPPGLESALAGRFRASRQKLTKTSHLSLMNYP